MSSEHIHIMRPRGLRGWFCDCGHWLPLGYDRKTTLLEDQVAEAIKPWLRERHEIEAQEREGPAQ